MVYGWASQPFFTVDPQVFRHGPPQAMTYLRFIFSSTILFLLLFVFCTKISTIHTLYDNSSHLMYILPNNAYVAKYFSVDPMYSRYGPMGSTWTPFGSPGVRF